MWKGKHPERKSGVPSIGWKLAPKEQYNSLWEISLAVEIASLLFNSGMQCTFKVIADVVWVTVTQENYDAVGWHWQEKNNRKTLETKREKKQKTKKIQPNTKSNRKFFHTEGKHYKSGAFHRCC